MKHLTKSLLAVALLAAGTGAANASIATGTSAEAFMQVYDHTQGLTYDLDLGVTLAQLSTAVANHLSFSRDLSADAKWTTFTAGLDEANTSWGVVVGSGTKSMYTSANAALTTTSGQVTTGANNDGLAANRINIGMGTTVSQNLSKLVADSATGGTGQWAASTGSTNTLNNLWGGKGDAQAAIAYGSVGNFFLTIASTLSTVTAEGQFTLTGTTLSYSSAPSAVPLPAAVWMFGAGLMGVLRLNRRKSAAV